MRARRMTVAALQKRVDRRFQRLGEKLDVRFKAIDVRFKAIDARFRGVHRHLRSHDARFELSMRNLREWSGCSRTCFAGLIR
jgi:hypothetical protein